MHNIGPRIKNIRNILNLSQGQLAKELNISKQCISNIENSKSFASLPILYTLAIKYNINLNYLITGRGSVFISDSPDIDYLKNIITNEVNKALAKWENERF